jgi:hypothetical protein
MYHWVKTIFCLVSASLLSLQAFAAGKEGRAELGDYFTPASAEAASPDAEGFILRWSLLEPIAKDFSSNSMLTDSYLSEALSEEYFKDQFTLIPADGARVRHGKTTLLWHALDSKKFFVNLLRFAEGYGKEYFQQMYWAVTVIDCKEDIENVRLAGGVNSGAVWYLNGEEVLRLTNDRDLIVDDCMSQRLTLKKGRNILRGAVFNGQGMATFCLRFVDESGRPVTGYTLPSVLPNKKK